MRDHDIVGRFSAERFVAIGVQADAEGAMAFSRRIMEILKCEPVAVDRTVIPVQVRIGGATNRSEGVEILEDLFSVAESALLDARAENLRIKIAGEVTV